MAHIKILDGRSHVWQWDTSIAIRLVGSDADELHFANEGSETAYFRVLADGECNIPNICLQTPGQLRVYAFKDGHYTDDSFRIQIVAREKPADYIEPEREAELVDALEDRLSVNERFIENTADRVSENDDFVDDVKTALKRDDDFIDNVVSSCASVINANMALPYGSLTFPIPIGAYTIYNNLLYRCTTPIPSSESWTAAHWTHVNIAGELVKVDPTLSIEGDAADAEATGNAIGDLKSALAPIIRTKTLITFTSGAYIRTGNIGSAGTIIDLTPVPSSERSYAIVDCSPGDIFELTALGGGNSARAWCFATVANALISNAGSGEITVTITAPATATKLILNNNNPSGHAYKIEGSGGFDALTARVTNAEADIGGIKDTIADFTECNRNLWGAESSISFTKSQTVTLPEALPAGTYTLSAVITSSDTDTTVSRFQVNSSSTTRDLARGERASGTFTFNEPITSFTFFAASKSTTSVGDTATWADIQLETGSSATAYVPHALTAVDITARSKINKIVKFVSTAGSDTNDGGTYASAYATIGKALSENANTIYVARGTYTEDIAWNEAYLHGYVRIICDNAVLIPPTKGMHFRFCDVEISGLTVDVTNASSASSYGFLLLNCTGKMVDCAVIGASGAGGFRLDGSRVTLTRCTASNCAVDGFNGHTVNTGYETEITLIDCIAHDCGDDGASIHESGKMYVIGGEYYNNVQTGLAPHDLTVFEALNVHCHNNGIGIEAVKDTLSTGETPAVGRVIGCILDHNTSYGLDVKNYTVNALGNAYASNGTDKTRAGAGATINAFTAD